MISNTSEKNFSKVKKNYAVNKIIAFEINLQV